MKLVDTVDKLHLDHAGCVRPMIMGGIYLIPVALVTYISIRPGIHTYSPGTIGPFQRVQKTYSKVSDLVPFSIDNAQGFSFGVLPHATLRIASDTVGTDIQPRSAPLPILSGANSQR